MWQRWFAASGLFLILALPAWAKPVSVIIRVPGIACKVCAGDIHTRLLDLGGVRVADVDVERRRVRVTYDDDKASVADLLAAIDSLGFTGAVEPIPAKGRP